MSKARKLVTYSVTSLLGSSLLLGLLYCWVEYVEPFQLELITPELELPHLPQSLDGLNVLFLSDSHVDQWTRREESLLNLLRSGLKTKPDILIWGGDYLFNFGKTEQGLRLVKAVQQIFPDTPTFGVLGNAEHKISVAKREKFIEELGFAGVSLLNNRHETIRLRNTPLTIVGVDDPYYGHDDLGKAMQDVPKNQFTILISHSPQIVFPAASAGVDLMLSGHTHGGQVRIPGIGALRAQNPLGRHLDMGVFDSHRLRPILQGRVVPSSFRLYITRGIGVAQMLRFSWIRPRFFCRPEVTQITLRRPRTAVA